MKMKDKRLAEMGELTEACLKCGAALGEPYIIGQIAGIKIEGDIAWVYDEDDVLCHVCMDDEVLAEDGA